MAHQSDLIEKDILAYLKSQEEKSLLRFITCGSVDDGKSTLIGRLLWDSKMVFEDQLAALEADSKKVGTQGGAIDYALLLDGLQAEREQGITIDVAYRFFSTDRRKFIVADTPGHEQYTRNMVTGASTAKVAVILVDARKGLLTQTRRHSYLVSLVGIRHIVLAINKMDLIDFDAEKFAAIEREYREFAAPLGFSSITALPISALNGDNIIEKSANTPWYQGPPLLHFLETVQVEDDRVDQAFRLPVQWVNRPNLDFRGFCGTVASGAIRPGDEIRVASSGQVSKVSRIVTMNGDLDEAVAGQAVTLTLEDEIDISRGDMLTRSDAPPLYTRHPEAQLVWLHDEPLQPGQLYLVKTATGVTPGRVTAVHYATDVNTLEQKQVATLGLNEIGLARLELDRPVSFDPYRENRDTGSFILIDRFTNATVAAGMVVEALPKDVAELTEGGAGTGSSWVRRISLGEVAATNLNLVDLREEKGAFVLDVPQGLLEHLAKGNRLLFRLRDLGQLEPVAFVAYENCLAFEFDRTPEGISVLLYKRSSHPHKDIGDDGVGI
ncbi:Sulfate adenylyltransferase subunit 1/Adenyly23Slfate kinase [Citrifermentans bremense]|uniref:Sulfate adenylyltransferase subunit 1 n=1 Tax=Citrifermentans bremense TaxID=60035 RepID=A0A6S6M6V9_9BACT|nr:sulfate adenylyltransferase subunit CysN [Citrifermentans bremense]BCG47454.1 Sulfate adenylyltransferase subunit 1/Adenyly23Slfate kinase [Citrifermentans bremense]